MSWPDSSLSWIFNASVHPSLSDYEVTGGLSTYPTCGHIEFACRHQAVHILVRLMEVLSRSMVTPFLSCTTLPKMSLDSHSRVSLALAEPLTIAHGGDDFLHTHLAIIGFQLRKFLKAKCHAHLVASGCAYQSVYLVEIQGRQLIDDDADRNVLALSCIHPRYKAVENQGIQCTSPSRGRWQ